MGRERAKAVLIHLTSHLAQIKPWVQLNRQKTQVTFSWATACSAFFFWSSSCCSLLLFSPSSFISLARSWRSLFSSADCLRRNIFTAFLTRSTGCINSDSNINTKPYLCSQRAGLGGGFFPPPPTASSSEKDEGQVLSAISTAATAQVRNKGSAISHNHEFLWSVCKLMDLIWTGLYQLKRLSIKKGLTLKFTFLSSHKGLLISDLLKDYFSWTTNHTHPVGLHTASWPWLIY